MKLSDEEYDELIQALYKAANDIVEMLPGTSVFVLATYFDGESDEVSWDGDVMALVKDAAVQVIVKTIERHLPQIQLEEVNSDVQHNRE